MSVCEASTQQNATAIIQHVTVVCRDTLQFRYEKIA